jgi:hypothetical protein
MCACPALHQPNRFLLHALCRGTFSNPLPSLTELGGGRASNEFQLPAHATRSWTLTMVSLLVGLDQVDDWETKRIDATSLF